MKKVLSIVCLLALTVCCLFAFASCGAPNSNPDDAKAALEENGLKATKDTVAQPLVLKGLGIDDVDCVVSAAGKIDDEYAYIYIIYFEETDDAKEAWEDVQEYADKQKSDEAEDSEWVCEKSGKMIYFGTKNAVKAAK